MQPLLNVENLIGGYTHKDVLHNISFQVNHNEIVGLIGLNGAGKSTTIKHVIGLLQEKSGEIRVNGQTIQENLATYRQQIAYIPETPILYDELTLRSEERRVGKKCRSGWRRYK